MTGLRLLALDGGGVRGLVSLHILKQLLYLMNPSSPPKPCDVFDIIAGTSTGGLIAIMLGLFEMDVQSCIEKYQDLAKVVFTPRKRARVFGRVLPTVFGAAPFDNKLLEQEIKRLSLESLGDEDASLYRETAKCKTFVCASLSNGETVRLRSYKSSFEDSMPCSIWEAGRATSAAPTFFDPITFTNGIIFRDGALEANNPIYEVLQEAMTEFPSEEIDTIVSIGTGVPTSINMGNGLISVAKACSMIATSTERIARQFEADLRASNRHLQGRYFRFNVSKGVEGVRLEEWQKADVMISNTLSYLRRSSTRKELSACVRRLNGQGMGGELSKAAVHTRRGKRPAGSIKTPRTSGVFGFGEDQHRPSSSKEIGALVPHKERAATDDDPDSTVSLRNPFYQLDRIGKNPVPYFVPRRETKQIHDHFANMDNVFRTRVVCLLGLGGSGKTQLTLQYAWSSRDEFGVVLWVDASSQSALLDSFQLAASQLGLRLPWNREPTSDSLALETYTGADTMKDVVAVKQELRRRNQPWLMIFDQADDEDVLFQLEKYIPSDSHGHVLVTSRRQEAYRLGQRYINIDSLPKSSAVDLLLYHTGIQHPSAEQFRVAEEIVNQLDCIALAVDLAGSYIQTPGGLQNYLDLYQSDKEELYRRSLGKTPSSLTGYNSSVFSAWRISMAAIPEDAGKLLNLLCFLDPTNLSKELLRRACSPKRYWDSRGEVESLDPSQCGVPIWLLELLRESDGEWSDFKFHEAVNTLESLFFVRQEIFQGTWLHETGTIDASSLVADGGALVLLRLPRPLHDLGRYFLKAKDRRKYGYDAFSVVVHGFRNDISEIENLGDVSRAPLYIGEGGESKDSLTLRRDLEQLRGHIEVFKSDISQNRNLFRRRRTLFDRRFPAWYQGEVIMFASMSWRHHLREQSVRNSTYVGSSVIEPWEAIMAIADTVVATEDDSDRSYKTSGIWSGENQRGWQSQSNSFLGSTSSAEESGHIPHPLRSSRPRQTPDQGSPDGKGTGTEAGDEERTLESDFVERWVIRQSKYFERLARSNDASGKLPIHTGSMYRLTAMAESLRIRFPLHSEQMIMSRLEDWVRVEFSEGRVDRETDNVILGDISSSDLYMNWQESYMGRRSLAKWETDLK